MTHEQACSHNAIHEALLMNGYEWTFYPEEWEDHGTGETGPMVSHSPAYYEYTSDWERVITVDGAIVHREARDLAFEAWADSMAEAHGDGDVIEQTEDGPQL